MRKCRAEKCDSAKTCYLITQMFESEKLHAKTPQAGDQHRPTNSLSSLKFPNGGSFFLRRIVMKGLKMEAEQTRACPDRVVSILSSDSVIVVDDHCYAIQNWNGNKWGFSPYIFNEAIAVLKGLPDNPDDAEIVTSNAE